MINWLHMNGYGMYVWSAYGVSMACLVFYLAQGIFKSKKYRQKLIKDLMKGESHVS